MSDGSAETIAFAENMMLRLLIQRQWAERVERLTDVTWPSPSSLA